MANLMDMLQGQLTPELLQELGSHIGSDNPQQTAEAANGVFSTLLGGLANNASTPDGADKLNSALERDHDGGLLDNLMGAMGGGGLGSVLGSVLGGGGNSGGGGDLMGNILGSVMGGGQSGGLGGILGSVLGGGGRASDGAGILGHILGGNQEPAAAAVAQKSGLDVGQIMKLMPILAPIVMGVLGKMRNSGHLDTGNMGNVLGGAAQQSAQSSGMGDILGSILGGGGGGGLMGNILGSVLGGGR